jgi:hypothetical protein
MLNSKENQQLASDLILPWTITTVMLLMLTVYIVVCHFNGEQFQQHWPEDQRVLLRTLFYVCAIITLPVTNLIRHIQLRLNETMPGNKPAKKRYLLTIIVSMTLVESVGVLGFIMFLLGDDFNTLYIFTGMSALGLFLYRPKADEYARICMALANKNE